MPTNTEATGVMASPSGPVDSDVLAPPWKVAAEAAARRRQFRVVQPGERAQPAGADAGGTAEQQQDTTPTPDTGVPLHNVEWGGKIEGKKLSAEVRASVTEHIRDRYDAAKALRDDVNNPRLNDYDRLLLQQGESFVTRLAGSEPLSEVDIAVAWSVISDELFQKASATKSEIENESGRFQGMQDLLGDRPLVGGLIRRFARMETSSISTAEAPHYTSAYLDKLGYATWDGERTITDFEGLMTVRSSLEEELGIQTDGFIPDLGEKNGIKYHDAAVEAAVRILERDHGGVTLRELEDTDRFAAARVRQTALQEGLMDYYAKGAEAILKGEAPEVKLASIEGHIENLQEKSSDEVIAVRGDESEEAAERYKEAKKEVRDLVAEKSNARSELPKATRALANAQHAADNQNGVIPVGRPGAGMPELDFRIIQLQTNIGLEQVAFRAVAAADPNASNLRAGHTERIAAYQKDQKELQDRRAKLNEDLALAQATLDYYNDRIVQIDGRPATRARRGRAAVAAIRGELPTARAVLSRATTDAETAKKALKEAEEGLTPVKKVTVDALKQHKKVGENYEEVITERFKSRGPDGREDRLRGAALGSTAIIDGHVVGAERIRENILGITDPKWWTKEENQALARRMYSDEAVAKAVIDVFRIDTGRIRINNPAPVGGTISIEQCFTEIARRRGGLEAALDNLTEEKAKGTTGATLAFYENAVTLARDDIQAYEQPLLKVVLPYMQQANEFKRGDVMRTLIRQGLDSAAQGKAFWNGHQAELYEKPEAELNLEAASVLEEHKGVATFVETNMEGYGKEPRVMWEGQLSNIRDHRGILGFDVPSRSAELTFRITNDFDREEARAMVDVLIDETFLKQLPANLPVGSRMVPEIRDLFYDNDRTPPTLRTEIRERDREGIERLLREQSRQIDNKGTMWLSVNTLPLRGNSSTDMLNVIDATIAPDASHYISIATANTVLAMTPDERQETIKGFHTLSVPGVDLLDGNPPSEFVVQYDNDGVFWIRRRAAGSARQPLEEFYKDMLENYRVSLNVQNLDPTQRAAMQAQVYKIQNKIGREVFLSAQRR